MNGNGFKKDWSVNGAGSWLQLGCKPLKFSASLVQTVVNERQTKKWEDLVRCGQVISGDVTETVDTVGRV